MCIRDRRARAELHSPGVTLAVHALEPDAVRVDLDGAWTLRLGCCGRAVCLVELGLGNGVTCLRPLMECGVLGGLRGRRGGGLPGLDGAVGCALPRLDVLRG